MATTRKYENGVMVFDTSLLKQQEKMPSEFVWSAEDLTETTREDLKEPLIDLSEFAKGDEEAMARACELVREACEKHGFFQVTNHGVDPLLIQAAYDEIGPIFSQPLDVKLNAKRKQGSVQGYSGAHADRFKTNLPWKETYSFEYSNQGSDSHIIEHFKSAFGDNLDKHTGEVYQRFCEAMKNLSEVILVVLAMSLGVERSYLKEFYKDGGGIMRCNLYPPCNSSNLTMGTGPHSDPTSVTILHQDQVGGLEVFIDNKWLAVRPRPEAFVINVGDTFQALTNGKYKSCLHRALVNREKERRSLVYFVIPKKDKTVKPPEELIKKEEERKYPDFKWSDFYTFTQYHYRPNTHTLPNFIQWFLSSNNHSAAAAN
ncbi:gibberellin 20 oxidase 2-like [Prosopis cineraria]|uniref:gibberellin 20 oxidase 2-like n=1 Tax=Prosopis cineraria TaxID=364024 RepID=UPI00240FD70D|nr:gibberellin 20 oxidase 2-like [Prosopis cineraria]